MASAAIDDGAPTPRASRRLGWAISGLAIAFLAADATAKLLVPELMIANSPPLGLPAEPGFYRLLGAILVTCALLYALPRTALLGAVLLTGYLGGAVATHLRVDSPLFSHTLFGIYVGAFVWAGLLLRDRRLLQLVA